MNYVLSTLTVDVIIEVEARAKSANEPSFIEDFRLKSFLLKIHINFSDTVHALKAYAKVFRNGCCPPSGLERVTPRGAGGSDTHVRLTLWGIIPWGD